MAALVTGCGSDASSESSRSVVGNWNPTSGDFSSFGGLQLVEYHQDGTLTERTDTYGVMLAWIYAHGARNELTAAL
ncbi:MAG TPA: hypothetical protein VHE30_11750 [Polyangiaceae bacterium]|nr:hypothetical protein [Polyangiaceae bacterium]